MKGRSKMNNMSKEEYDMHINRLAVFSAHVVQQAVNMPEESEEFKDLNNLYETLGKAFMALRRERIMKYGNEDSED